MPLHAVSLSGGKDSTAMLLLMIERGMPIDRVLYADTGMDFPEMQNHIDKLDAYLYAQRGLHITKLRNPQGFEYYLLNVALIKPAAIAKRIAEGQPVVGYGWPGGRRRWCTGELKVDLLDLAASDAGQDTLHYVGIAADEAHRCKDKQYPLVEWGITEAQALQICYDRGYDWGGLYRMYNRVSCWCCPLQRIGELRTLRKHHPELWVQLLDMDAQVIATFGSDRPRGQFRRGWTVAQLDARFAAEDKED